MHLPAELKAIVVDQVALRLDLGTLAALARVSKEWSRVATEGLYRSFVFDDTLHEISVLHRFVSTLVRNPVLAEHVQYVDVTLRLEDDDEDHDSDDEGNRLERAQPLQPLMRLLVLELTQPDGGDPLELLRGQRRSLVLAALLTMLPRVQELTLGLPKFSTQTCLARAIHLISAGRINLPSGPSLQKLREIHVWPRESTFFPPERNDYLVQTLLARELLSMRTLTRVSFLDLDILGPAHDGDTKVSSLVGLDLGDQIDYLALDYENRNFCRDTVVSVIAACSGLKSLRFAIQNSCAPTARPPFRRRLGAAIAGSKGTLQKLVLMLPEVELGTDSIGSFHGFQQLQYLFIDLLALLDVSTAGASPLQDILPERLTELYVEGLLYQAPEVPPKETVQKVVKLVDGLLRAKGEGRLPDLRAFGDACYPPLFEISKQRKRWSKTWSDLNMESKPDSAIRELMEKGSTDELFQKAIATIDADWREITFGSDDEITEDEDEDGDFSEEDDNDEDEEDVEDENEDEDDSEDADNDDKEDVIDGDSDAYKLAAAVAMNDHLRSL